jgi:tetratricopeptide (TPR) repeat protein
MNLLMKNLKLLSSLIVLILLLTGCVSNNSYKRARYLYKKDNYVAAIEIYDQFLEREQEGISPIYAQLERSDCYYQLGMKAYDKQNWLLAQKLFFLANSQSADELLDNCYFQLAALEMEAENPQNTLEYYDYILQYLNTSELIPEILTERIILNSGTDKTDEILADYKELYINYPESDTSLYVSQLVDDIILMKVNTLKADLSSVNSEETLQQLLDLVKFPTTHKVLINKEIAQTYLFISDQLISAKEYDQVVVNLHNALQFDPTIDHIVEEKLEETFSYFVIHGNDLAQQMHFDEALDVFDQCLAIYPDFKPASDAKAEVERVKWNYLESQKLAANALDLEERKEYKRALELYKRASQHFKTQEITEKIFIMNNLLKAQKNPRSFALELVNDYKNGKIISEIKELEKDLVAQYGENIVKSSDWDVQYSTGTYKYEVRYDILTPDINYYFVWLTDLKKGIISPLNKISEELM